LQEETVFYRLYNEALIRKLEERCSTWIRSTAVWLRARNASAAWPRTQDLIYRYEFSPQRGFTYVSPAASLSLATLPKALRRPPIWASRSSTRRIAHCWRAVTRGETAPGSRSRTRWVHRRQMIWTEQRNVPVFNEAGQLIALEGIARDVTFRKHRERELEAMAAVSGALRVAHTRDEMLPVIIDQLLALLEADGAALAMLESAGRLR
jgi:PAS domain-containing protein